MNRTRGIPSLKSNLGYALPAAITMGVVITTLLIFLIHAVYIQMMASSRLVEKNRLDTACESAMQKLLNTDLDDIEGVHNVTVDSVPVMATIVQRGLMYEVDIVSAGRRDTARVIGYAAGKGGGLFRNGLVLSRPGTRVQVTGNTRITGDIAAATRDFSHATIFGIEPQRVPFVTGSINTVGDIPMKQISDAAVSRLFEQHKDTSPPDTLVDHTLNIAADSLALLAERYRRIHIEGDLFIGGSAQAAIRPYGRVSVAGRTFIENGTSGSLLVELYSQYGITVGSNVDLSDVILVSPHPVAIGPGGVFRHVQILTREDITVWNCRFYFPSVIVLQDIRPEGRAEPRSIRVENSDFNGTLMLTSSEAGRPGNMNTIYISDDSRVQGLVYSENNVEPRGYVQGIVYSYNVTYYKEPTQYINWLVAVRIDREELDEYFLLPVGMTDNRRYGVLDMRWVD